MPLILHAAWLRSDQQLPDGQLFFWAENQEVSDATTEAAYAGSTARQSARQSAESHARNHLSRERTRVQRAPSHPLQAPASQLREVLGQQLPSLALGNLLPLSAEVWTPSVQGYPSLQRTLLTAAAENGTPVRVLQPELAPWQVTGLALSPYEALATLTQLNNGSSEKSAGTATIYHSARQGKDLLFWSHCAKFALELLINQHYLPALHTHADGYLIAAWQPFVGETRLQERFEHLVQMMPPVCRSYNLLSLNDAPTSAQLVEHFVAAVIDAAIRAWGHDLATGDNETAAQRWLGQLLNGERRLGLPPQQAFQFYQHWHTWTEQLQYTAETTFRVCFALEEPGSTGGSASQWRLKYLLQARDNPDARIRAREVWKTQTGSLRIGNRRVDQPQERLRAGLNAAGRIFEPIARSLRSTHPEEAMLSTDEAYRFLKDYGPLLESSGFGVVLPEWWSADRRAGLALRLRLFTDDWDDDIPDDRDDDLELADLTRVNRRRRDAGLSEQVRYAWELTLGGEVLGKSDFERMASLKTPLLNVGNRWVELDPDQVTAAQRFIIDKQPSGAMSLLEAVRVVQSVNQMQSALAAPATAPAAYTLPEGIPAGLPVDAVDVEGWLSHAIAQLQEQHAVTFVREPEGFEGSLRPYQRRGVGWLLYLRQLGLGACLADDMGLGKTIQAIALLLHARANDEAAIAADAQAGKETSPRTPALLICPTSVVANWRREVERFAPSLRVMVHHGGGRLTDQAFADAVETHDLILTSYGTARRDIEMLNQWRWSELILDEAQNIKNPTAKQTQAVRSLSARNRIALTGTPVENRLSELWSIIEFLNPGYLENHERFRQRYIVPIERYNDDDRAGELRRLVQPFLLRRVKSDPTIISDLPEKNEMVVYSSLTAEQATLYEQVVQETLEQLDRSDGIQRRGLVLGLLTRLKQITNHPAHYLKQEGPLAGRSSKLERLSEMLEEALAVGDHALVFTQFVEMGMLLQKHLKQLFGVEVLFLHGGTPAPQRDQMVQAFQEEDGPPIFILSLRAGGAGLNLTRASHVFHFDRWWNPAVENQATDRAFRIGQRRNVQVHKFVVAGTLEERIHAIVEGKQNLADHIVGSGEQWLTELSTEQLRDLLMLRREMIDE